MKIQDNVDVPSEGTVPKLLDEQSPIRQEGRNVEHKTIAQMMCSNLKAV